MLREKLQTVKRKSLQKNYKVFNSVIKVRTSISDRRPIRLGIDKFQLSAALLGLATETIQCELCGACLFSATEHVRKHISVIAKAEKIISNDKQK